MNPFMANHKLKVIEISKSYKESKHDDIQEGAVLKWRNIRERYLIEQQEKTSIYKIPYIENILFTNMKSSGRDMLLYVMYNIRKDEDFINLKIDKVCGEIGISKQTMYSAIQQLIDNAIICKKHTTEYWVNPLFIFKGDRLKYYGKYCPDCIEIAARMKLGDVEESKPVMNLS